MPSIKILGRLVQELEDQLVVCMRCGMCQAVCPLFAETGREADVARGKLALLDGLAREIFQNPQGVQDRLARCLLCGSCAANCPSGVKVLDIFIKARAILAGYLGLSPLKKAIFRGLLGKPGLLQPHPGLGGQIPGDLSSSRWMTSWAPPAPAFSRPCSSERHFKPLAPVALASPGRWPMNTAAGASGLKVAFFVGCLIDKIFPGGGRGRPEQPGASRRGASFCRRTRAAAAFPPWPAGTPPPLITWCATTWLFSGPNPLITWSPPAPPAPPPSKRCGPSWPWSIPAAEKAQHRRPGRQDPGYQPVPGGEGGPGGREVSPG